MVQTATAEAKEGEDEESLQEGESYEDDEESVQASIVSGTSGVRSPKGKAAHPTTGGAGGGSSVVGGEAEVLKEQLNEDDEDGAAGPASAGVEGVSPDVEQPPPESPLPNGEEEQPVDAAEAVVDDAHPPEEEAQ